MLLCVQPLHTRGMFVIEWALSAENLRWLLGLGVLSDRSIVAGHMAYTLALLPAGELARGRCTGAEWDRLLDADAVAALEAANPADAARLRRLLDDCAHRVDDSLPPPPPFLQID